MLSTRQIIGTGIKLMGDLVSSAQNATEALVFGKLACNELDESLFPIIGAMAIGGSVLRTVSKMMMNPTTDAYEGLANTWEASKGGAAAMIGVAIFYKGSLIPAANLFNWALIMAVLQTAAEHGHEIKKMSKDEFLHTLKRENFPAKKLAHIMMGYIKTLSIPVLLTYSSKVGQALDDAKNKEVTTIDQGVSWTIAVASAEQAIANFGMTINETYDIWQKYQTAKKELGMESVFHLLEGNGNESGTELSVSVDPMHERSSPFSPPKPQSLLTHSVMFSASNHLHEAPDNFQQAPDNIHQAPDNIQQAGLEDPLIRPPTPKSSSS